MPNLFHLMNVHNMRTLRSKYGQYNWYGNMFNAHIPFINQNVTLLFTFAPALCHYMCWKTELCEEYTWKLLKTEDVYTCVCLRNDITFKLRKLSQFIWKATDLQREMYIWVLITISVWRVVQDKVECKRCQGTFDKTIADVAYMSVCRKVFSDFFFEQKIKFWEKPILPISWL